MSIPLIKECEKKLISIIDYKLLKYISLNSYYFFNKIRKFVNVMREN